MVRIMDASIQYQWVIVQFLKVENVNASEIYRRIKCVCDAHRYSDGLRIFVMQEAVVATSHDLVKRFRYSSCANIPIPSEYLSVLHILRTIYTFCIGR